MYGFINLCVKALVVEKFGEEMWEKIRHVAEVKDSFISHSGYSDDITLRLVAAASEVIGVPVEAVLELFGEYFFTFCQRSGYDEMLRVLGGDLMSFLENLDALHSYLSFSYKQMEAPSFRCETRMEDDALILHYYSHRKGLHPIVVGIVRAVARDFFDSEIKMEVLDESHEEERNGKKEHVTFAIFVQKKKHPKPPPTIVTTDQTNDLNQSQMNGSTKPVMDDDPTDDVIDTENRGNDIEKDIVPGSQSIMNLVTNFTPFYPERLWLSQEVFCEYFPYHIVFDSYLRPLQTGLHIQRLLPTLQSTEADTLDSFFKIIHPQIDWKLSSMRKFINMQFVLETKRSVITQGWGKDRPMLQLRGQMIWMENLNAMLYVCSPRVASLKELEDRCLHLSDIPQHDVTRDLILFNHQRLAEIELGKQLEQKKEELRNALNDLEAEKQKTDMLLHSMLPRQVADQLREGKKVEAGEFTIVTILFSDIVSFTNICAECRPIDIVNMLNALYVRFDKLTSVHDVYKVETIGDAYMVVGGLPIPVPSHADRIANMALGMTVACQEVMSPVTREPIKIRVGIHSGPVVAGVVGRKMPRYCLFGDTVNTASRMESHGLPGKIHISSASCQCLIEENFEISERGEILVKGKGTMKTYFVNENKNASMEEIMGKKRKASTPEKKDSVKLETDSLIKFGTDPYSHNTEAIPMVYNDEDRMAEFMKTPQRKLTPAPSDSNSDTTKPEDQSSNDVTTDNAHRATTSSESKRNEIVGATQNHGATNFGRRSRRADIQGSRTCAIL